MEKMPVFVKIDEYHDVRSVVVTIRKKLDEAKETLLRINELKNEEDHQLELWHGALEEIERKMDFVDQSLSEPEEM